jgi:hypothetical protein
VEDHVFTSGPQTAVRVADETFRPVHNDTDASRELLIFSTRADEPVTETRDGFC